MIKHLIILSAFCFTVFSCKSVSDRSRLKDNPLVPAVSLEQYEVNSNSISFGIPFETASVQDAEDFWQNYDSNSSLTGRLDLNADFESQSHSDKKRLINRFASSTVFEAIKEYSTVANEWIKLMCEDVDMDQAAQGVLAVRKFKRSKEGDPICSPKDSSKLSNMPNDSNFKIRLMPLTTYLKNAEKKILEVEAEVLITGSISLTNQILFTVAGNYLIPEMTYAISKSFRVPVLKFDPDKKVPSKFFDFGELLLNRLPEEAEIILATGQGDTSIDLWRSGQKSTVGHFWKELPNNINKYIDPQKVNGMDLSYNYERVPIGGLHFTINSALAEYFKGTGMIVRMTKNELLDLYYNGGAWINIYDDLEHSGRKADIANLASCALPPNFREDGGFLMHEIILGGKLGRAFLESHKVELLKGGNCLN